MIKLLIGGSPCTHWSIAQTKDRETKAEGIGWELFLNYVIAKEKFQPDFFLYENNQSASQEIKDQIAKELGVGVDAEARFTYINSALVSAQNRQRFYVTNFGDIEQPEDRKILLKDILENGKCLNCKKAAEPVCVAQRGRYCDSGNRSKKLPKKTEQYFEARPDEKSNALTTVTKDNEIAEPVRVGEMPQQNGSLSDSHSKQYRVYSDLGKSTTLCGNGGGLGAKTGLYALPVGTTAQGKSFALTAYYSTGQNVPHTIDKHIGSMVAEKLCYAIPAEWSDSGEPIKAKSFSDGKIYTVYKVADGKIAIKSKEYPIKLKDGYYIIRKLTVKECARLQTMPDDYCRAVSDIRAYKALGNGWTAEVIIHLLNHALKDVPKNEEIVVLSMYDGIATGRYCLDKMGFTNVKYHACEIDPYPIKVAMDNYPDIIQCGDAFAVREDGWHLPM